VLDPFGKNAEKNTTTTTSADKHSIPNTTINPNPSDPTADSSKPKKEKKKKPPTPSSGKKDQAALSYLQTFHTARSTWKFSKNNQNWVLKHALNPAVIPGGYEEALASYLASLQSEGVRDRILKDARTVVEGKEEGKEDGEGSEVGNAKKVRAKLVLKALGHGEDSDDESESDSDSSSSDSSSSDSESDSENDESDSGSGSDSSSSDSDSD